LYGVAYETTTKKVLLQPECNPILDKVHNFNIMLGNERYPKHVPLYHNSSINLTCLNTNNRTKTILLWNKIYGMPFKHFIFGPHDFFKTYNCPVTNCELTNNRSKLDSSDLVVFHLRNKIDVIPERAFATQRFVHMVYESSVHCSRCTSYSDNVFNYSATFTPESDYSSIYWTDSGLYWAFNEQFDENFDFHAGKKKMAAALISNYVLDKTSDRYNYITKLNKFLPVDIYGVRSKLNCGKDCKKHIADNYMFYLAFENSLCRGYMTEKFLDTLNYNIIPVVMGLGNYSYYIPKSAYINAHDFESPGKLGEYLIYLSENKTAYNEYFKWKKYVKSEFFTRRIHNGFLCEMCVQLQLEALTGTVKQKQLSDIKGLYGMKENCMRGQVQSDNFYRLGKLNDSDLSFYMSDEKWE
jgi:hypothetical protein